eukprot:8906913-Pyramimonas_sp.AAC.1
MGQVGSELTAPDTGVGPGVGGGPLDDRLRSTSSSHSHSPRERCSWQISATRESPKREFRWG